MHGLFFTRGGSRNSNKVFLDNEERTSEKYTGYFLGLGVYFSNDLKDFLNFS